MTQLTAMEMGGSATERVRGVEETAGRRSGTSNTHKRMASSVLRWTQVKER